MEVRIGDIIHEDSRVSQFFFVAVWFGFMANQILSIKTKKKIFIFQQNKKIISRKMTI